MKYRRCLFFLVFLLFSNKLKAAQFSDAESLFKDLFQNYSTEIRPNQNLSEPTDVHILALLFSVNDFNEVSGVISIVGGFLLKWHDFRLTWTPNSYGGIESFPISKKKIWVPNMFLINPANKMEAVGSEDFVVRMFYSGTMAWVPGGLFKTMCDVNMYTFPFDTQKCSFSVALWGYKTSEARLVPEVNTSTMETTYYSPNAQWELERTIMKYSDIGNAIVELQIILKRRALYFIINMLAPILLLSVLNPLVFVLPVDSGERVSYSITIFLSFAVFMSLISENMPKSSEPMSILSYFLVLTMAMSTLICILTIVTLRLHFKDSSTKVSTKVRFLLRVLQLKCLCKPCRKVKKDARIRDVMNVDNTFAPSNKEQFEEPQDDVTWKQVAEAFDETFMYYFFFIVLVQWVILGIMIKS